MLKLDDKLTKVPYDTGFYIKISKHCKWNCCNLVEFVCFFLALYLIFGPVGTTLQFQYVEEKKNNNKKLFYWH